MRRCPRIAALTFWGVDNAITVPERGGLYHPPTAKRTRRRTRSAPPPAGSRFARLANNLPPGAGGDNSPSGRHIGKGPFQSRRVALSRPVCGSPAPHVPPAPPLRSLRSVGVRPGQGSRESPGDRSWRRVMLAQVIRGVVRVSATVALGAVPGGGYAALVGAVHLGVYGRWDRVPAFAVGCVVVGALFGLFGGVRWALSGEPAPDGSPPPAARGSSPAPLAVPSWPSGVPARRPGLRPRGGQPGRRPTSPRRRAIGRSVRGWDCPPVCR
jgi:hypothetical protein